MKTSLKADLMLLLVTLCWGISYFLMDVCLAEINPMNLNAIRFLVAFIVAYCLGFKQMQHVSRETIKYAFYISITLIFVYCGATYGVLYTSLSNCGFINGLSTVFTPIVGFFFYKRHPEKKLVLVVAMCMIGIALLSLDETFRPAFGDILCLVSATAYAFDLQITENAVKHEEVNAFQLGVFQLGFVGVYMLILSFIIPDSTLPQTPKVWAAALFLAIFCTGLAFIVQAIAQQYTSANHVGVIFALEPVFSGITAFFLAGEVLLPRAYFGAFLMVASLFIMEIDFSSLKKSK